MVVNDALNSEVDPLTYVHPEYIGAFEQEPSYRVADVVELL